MARILVMREMGQNCVDDVFHKTQYDKYENIKGANVGNKLWLMGLINSISTEENIVEFFDGKITPEEINARYDILIESEANIFCEKYIQGQENYVRWNQRIKIPTFVIACGAQARNYEELDVLCEAIREPASAFIRSIYETGGTFALRGYFTAELFEKLGFHDYCVTGCPSLYQCGADLQISNQRVEYGDFKPMVNGTMRFVSKVLKENKGSIFFDQGTYYSLLYGQWEESELKKQCAKMSLQELQLLRQDRIKLCIDLPDWANEITSNQFSFSCGSRIHGNIMPLLCGVPSTVIGIDSRTREMCEFYGIPMANMCNYDNRMLYEQYLNIDFKKFNTEFAAKHEKYIGFLQNCNIIKNPPNCSLLQEQIAQRANEKKVDRRVAMAQKTAIYEKELFNSIGHEIKFWARKIKNRLK